LAHGKWSTSLLYKLLFASNTIYNADAVMLTCFMHINFVSNRLRMLNVNQVDACQTHGASSHMHLTSKENYFGAKVHM
jgi:hypothetical protein